MELVTTQLMRGVKNIPARLRGGVVAIGNFDGVHKGHQALLAQVLAAAKRLNAPAVVITFEPQTSELFTPGKAPAPRLTRLREKFHALVKLGMDGVLVLHFTQQFAQMSAADFIEQVLVAGLGVRQVMVGDDFRFGKGRQGDYAFLQEQGTRQGFAVNTMAPFLLDNERVSSTRVRLALATFDASLVNRLLGHPYFMEGRVVRGDQRGRTIGFPTANIFLHRKVTPIHGVYVVRMYGIGNTPLPGVANIGTRPTVDGTRSLLEVHLFDFDADIYSRQVRVEFCKKLRDEQRYASFDLLKEQIWRDAEMARDYFLNLDLTTGQEHGRL
jgi:riboflavin kinase/FMN adenylyltransferase